MIRHLVFFKMKALGPEEQPGQRAGELVRLLRELPEKIPEIAELRAGRDFSNSPSSFDIGLMTAFQSREDLEAYRVHPEHQKVIQFVQAHTTERAVVDFEDTD